MNKKSKINPLFIKDANWVLTNATINAIILFFLSTKMEESGLSKFLITITTICQILCVAFGIIICIGWIVAIYTKNVMYIEPSKNEKGKDNGSNNN